MPQSTIFSWKPGGWIVLAGGGDPTSEANLLVDGNVLSRTVSNFPMAYIWSAGDIDAADHHLEQFQELGGRTGFLLDILSERNASIAEQLDEAGIIVLGDGPRFMDVQQKLPGIVIEAMERAFIEGATIYAIGRMAGVFASWMPIPPIGVAPGLGWVQNAIIKAPYDPDQHANELQAWLTDNIPDAYGIGLGEGAAIAFSPQGQVELWGRQATTILLGKNLGVE